MHDEFWTLTAAAEQAERHYELEELDGGPELGSVQEVLWFHAAIAAHTGEQVERAANALERIAAVLEAMHQEGKLS